MGVAYTTPANRVIHADFDAKSSHCLRSGLHQAVQMAGWTVDQELEKGYVYIMTSVQDASLQCKVKIQDTNRNAYVGYSGYVDVVFMDIEEENISQNYVLGWSPSMRMRAHITPCQIFTYRPGQAGNNVMGGIPWLDPNVLLSTEDPCADEEQDIKTTRCWWSCSNLETSIYAHGVGSFRTSWHTECSATLHNNTFVSEASFAIYGNGRLRMLPMQRPGAAWWESYGNVNFAYPVMLRWIGDDEPLCLDALIAWNDEHPVKVRGVLWDAFVRTKYAPWEDPLTFDASEWFSYTSGDRSPTGGGGFHWYSPGDIFTIYLRDPGLTYFECKGKNYAY